VNAAIAAPVERPNSAAPRVSKDSHLSGLDLARGLAAIAVAFFHFTNNGWLPKDHWMASLGWYGHLGVRAFFVMSGFVVPFAMWRGGYTGQAFFSFMTRRLVRLYPPYVISVCTMAILALVSGTDISAVSLVAHAFYINDLIDAPWLLEVYWTLAIEVQFYIVVALVWRIVAVGRSWPFVIMAIATVAATFVSWPDRSLPNYANYFLLGITAFRWHREIGSRAVNSIVGVLALLALAREDGFPSAVAAILPLAMLAFPITVPRWGRFLGDSSYSLYLFHLVTGATFLAALEKLPLSVNVRAALIPVALAISVGAAWLAFRWIEAPAMQWARRFTYRPSTHRSKADSAGPAVPVQA
jgi:peptidoglycan/LPS O-acetylase OafA/YrhL